MNIVNWLSGQRVVKQVLSWLTSTTTFLTESRFTDTFIKGVLANSLNNMLIIGKDVDNTLTDFYHIKVDTGTAYDSVGDRISITNAAVTYNSSNPTHTTDDGLGNLIPTPRSTGSYNIDLTAGIGSINYIYIGYLQTIDDTIFTLHKVTDAKQFYQLSDGYQIVVNTTDVNPDSSTYVFLGQVDLTGSNTAISSTISIVNRDIFRSRLQRIQIQTPNNSLTDKTTTYSGGNNSYFLDDHIKAVGSGVITAANPHGTSPTDIGISSDQLVAFHRQHEHAAGIIAGDYINPFPTASALYCQTVTFSPPSPSTPDYVLVKALGAMEYAIVNGLVFSITSFPTDTNISFVGQLAGTYNIYLDSMTGTIGITTSSIALDVTKLWLGTVAWDGTDVLSAFIDRRQLGTVNLLARWADDDGRPQAPQEGNSGYNFFRHQFEYYNGSTWVQP